MAYRNWNVSAYSYDSDRKRYVFKSELGKSIDVPKYIKLRKYGYRMDKSLLKRIIVSYGVLALHSLQKSANKDYKLKDFKIEHLADEIEVMIGVYPKEIAIVKYFNLKDED